MKASWSAGVVACLLLCAAPAGAFHTIFDFTVDRFELTGNNVGAGTVVSEFDTDRSGWYTAYGTSTLSGGRLHVQNPGTHIPGPDGTTLDLTEVAYSQTLVYQSYGDFVATAVFDSIIPAEGRFFHFTLYTFGNGALFNEIFGLDIHTVNGQTSIEQHKVELDLSHGVYQTVAVQSRPLTAAELTGQTHFRISYDMASSTVRSSFSLDGGVTFESPFDPVPIFTEGRIGGQFLLGADPHTVTTPTTTSTTSTTETSTTETSTTETPTTETPTTSVAPASTTTVVTTSTTSTTRPVASCARTDCIEAPESALAVHGKAARRAIVWSWRGGSGLDRSAVGDPMLAGGTAYALCIRDDTGLVFRQTLPAGGSCGKRSCWRAIGDRGFAWKDAGASEAVSALRVIADGRKGSQVTATVKSARLLPAFPVVVQLENDTGTCWASDVAALAKGRRGR